MLKKIFSTLLILLIATSIFSACSKSKSSDSPVVSQAKIGWKKVDQGAFLLDVRSVDEYNIGALPNAVNIPYDKIAQQISKLPQDKSTEIVIYCRTGRRSAVAKQTLTELGYTNLHNAGGYVDLKQLRH